MKDRFGREINYMRISVTDRCNLHCRYCVPDKVAHIPMQELLTYEEITEICREAVALGITHFRITGGEPLVRKEVYKLVKMLHEIDEKVEVTLTTNGVLLAEQLPLLIESGINAINVSLDTLSRKRYLEITGHDKLEQVWDGINQAYNHGIRVKVNCVLHGMIEESDWESLILIAKDRAIDVRFIELMPIGQGKKLLGVSNEKLMALIQEKYAYIDKDDSFHGNGPAIYYKIQGFQGSIGLISPIHGKYCASCNRLRMNAVGMIKSCLCYGNMIDMKTAIRNHDLEMVRARFIQAIETKPQAHCFENLKNISERQNMVALGG